MPHPVGGAMGVTCVMMTYEGIHPRPGITSSYHKDALRWFCRTVVL